MSAFSPFFPQAIDATGFHPSRPVGVGFHWLWTIGGTTPFTTREAALRVTVLDPWGPREPWAWRFEGQVGLMKLDEWSGPTLRVGFGVDFEALVR